MSKYENLQELLAESWQKEKELKELCFALFDRIYTSEWERAYAKNEVVSQLDWWENCGCLQGLQYIEENMQKENARRQEALKAKGM